MSFLSRIMIVKSRAHFSSGSRGRGSEKASFEGTRKRKSAQAKNRVGLLIAGFAVFYCVIGGRLMQYGVAQPLTTSSILPADRLLASRPDPSTATARFWRPTSAPSRCLPNPTRSSTPTR